MYLTIMRPEIAACVATFSGGLSVLSRQQSGLSRTVLIIKTSKESILTAKLQGVFKFYLAPAQISGQPCMAVVTAFFDNADSPLTILSPLIAGERLPEALEKLPNAFDVCFFDEHNREVFACNAYAELSAFRAALQSCAKAARSDGVELMQRAHEWFAWRSDDDDCRAIPVKLSDTLLPVDVVHYNMREDSHGYLGSPGFSRSTLRRPEPGAQQELDIIMLLQRVYTPSQIVHSPVKVADNEELVDIAVAGAHCTLLIQAKDSPNTDQTLKSSLERKQTKSVSQLKVGLSQLGGAVSSLQRNPNLKLAGNGVLDTDLTARPLVGVVIVKELFPGRFDVYSELAVKTMGKFGLPVVFFDYPEFERITRHCTSEKELLSAFDQILGAVTQTGLYPRISFDTCQAI
ncbi:hypothetical protein [Pseudomonas shirazensis]|uniref:hypothetical protein n=1 Tax=Pseudomonas shirazensis TaxID=2745494 RepID=UPI003985ED49